MAKNNNMEFFLSKFRTTQRSVYEIAHWTIENETTKMVWNEVPKEFQTEVIKWIIRKKKEDISPTPVLLVRGTGDRKSLVMQTIGVMNVGVAIIIENTLSLSVDQVGNTCDASKIFENVFSINPNQVKKRGRKKVTSEVLENLK